MAELVVSDARPVERRAENLDVLRAIAALLVLSGHAYFLSGKGFPFLPKTFSDLLLRQTATGVWLFFVLSGYLISRPFIATLIDGAPLPGLRAYATRRAFRIYPAYWVAVTAFIAVQGLKGADPWHVPIHYALLHNLVPGREEALFSVAWTLTLEVLFYVCVPVLALLIRRMVGQRPIAPAMLATGVLATWVLSIAWQMTAAVAVGGRIGQWLQVVLPASWSFFCPGILLAIGTRIPPTSRWFRPIVAFPRARGAWAAALFVCACAIALFWAGRPSLPTVLIDVIWNAAQQVFAVGYAILVGYALAARPWHERFGRWILELGLMSYGIYLWHTVVLAALLTPSLKRFVPMPHGGALAYIVHVAVLIALTIPIAWLSWHVLERPLNDVARRVGRSRVRSDLAV